MYIDDKYQNVLRHSHGILFFKDWSLIRYKLCTFSWILIIATIITMSVSYKGFSLARCSSQKCSLSPKKQWQADFYIRILFSYKMSTIKYCTKSNSVNDRLWWVKIRVVLVSGFGFWFRVSGACCRFQWPG